MRGKYQIFLAILCCAFVLLCSAVEAQQPAEDSLSTSQVEKQKSQESEDVKSSLNKLLKLLNFQRDKLSQLKQGLAAEDSALSSEEAKEQIESTSEHIHELERYFRELAAGFALFETRQENTRQSLQSQLESTIEPLLKELRALTEKPRKISLVREAIKNKRESLQEYDLAIKNTRELKKKASDQALVAELDKLLEEWERKRQTVKTEIEFKQQKLHQLEGATQDFTTSATEFLANFFRTRGRNLLVSILITLIFIYIITKASQGVQALHESSEETRRPALRAIQVILFVCTALGAIACFMISLYYFADWALLGLTSLVLLGMAWALRETVPRFGKELGLLLNIGTVREGELVTIETIPYRVDTLNLKTELSNPLLQGSYKRLPLKDLTGMRSRPVQEGEVWFPTRTGDWVLLDGDIFGQVTYQSEKTVLLELPGGAVQSFSTAAFVDLNPQCLTETFRISTIFGLSYDLQESMPEEIPGKYREYLRESLNKVADKNLIKSVEVRFSEAAASSLNLRVMVDCDGSLAYRYLELKDAIAQLCVRAANKFDHEIPFSQLTVHMAANEV